MLGKVTDADNHADWTRQLPAAEFALNNTTHSVTGYSASELLFGVKQRGPVVYALSEFIENEFQARCRVNLAEIRDVACKNMRKSQEYNEAYMSERSSPVRQYQVMMS